MNKTELSWVSMTKEELIKELDKANKEIITLNKIIDQWEKVYKPKKEIVDVNCGFSFKKDLQTITYINKYEIYHRAE